MAKLIVNVVLADPDTGEAVCFEAGAGSGDMPKWAVAAIGDHAWEGRKPSTKPEPVEDGPPPMNGKGSGIEEWRAYADRLEVPLDPDAKRDDIIAAIKAAGHPVEQAPPQ